MTKTRFPGNLADEYLKLQADKAELASREKALKEAILATREAAIEGAYARVSVSLIEGRLEIDYKAAALDLIAEKALESYRNKKVAPSYRFCVKARVPDARPAAA